ncbi:DUF1217 domain-containing protein [Jannaschia seohaensis]|uniref:Uncharacterized protein DUF1217 n=1 Tax=Jannaschia seohaensis TaxID=475081 RepID=A0A2Y9AXS8_9RHOB|nr:DUF1217 domain-containing protein [Jannaschia seohaensis]PWJ16147.1 uncharacterized protein DUF1217 [Jannaschia seohaensis]SSA49134.1 Protein of unknown function [Jannaschia seohaensis]
MTFQPYVPMGGLAGWRFLQSTIDNQKAAFERSPLLQRDLDYFAEKIGEVRTPEDLIGDFRLLSVALGAFGLSDDIGSKFLIRKVLEEGTLEPDALANKLSDKRYRELSKAFGFGDFAVPNTVLSDFPDKIAARYSDQAFEKAVGETNESMRLALNAQREFAKVADGQDSDRAKWFTILGTPPLRKVLEGAFGLPLSFGALDIDKQLEVFQHRSREEFGADSVAALAEPDTMARLLDRYTAITGMTEFGNSTITSPALVLLRGY